MASTINASTSGGLVTTADTSGVLQLQTANTTAVTIDASQNVGVGVTPSAWLSNRRVIEVGGQAAAVLALNGTAAVSEVLANAFRNAAGTYIYAQNGPASFVNFNNQSGNGWAWSLAPSGTAGNAITFTQAMTLDANGNLGVGTSSPSYSFHVVRASGTALGVFERTSGALAYIEGTTSTGVVGTGSNHPLLFTTNSGERARIDTSGNLLVGTTSGTKHVLLKNNSNNEAVQIENSASSNPYGSIIYFSAVAPNDATRYFLNCQDNAASRAIIRSNGGIANYQANNVNLSDRKEKTNFAPAGEYLSKICAIPVQTFNYIDQSEDDPGLTLGVVAQDVQAVAPELVMESNWGTEEEPKMRLSIYQTDLQYALMKCIQELKAELDQAKAEIATLKGA